MYSNYELESVRSMPLLSVGAYQTDNDRSQVSLNRRIDFYSRVTNYRQSKMNKHWKSKLHPEVLDKYDELMSQGQHSASRMKPRSVMNVEDSPIKDYDTTPRKKYQQIKSERQDKMRSLEEQNSNLRDQLYYLREALLLYFQTRPQK